ncbi:hypothetical protein FTO70_14305 [Methanosarcina sp. KYL-1]|uniref:hypothetical protein n=1 Tax=Methanosarcina sp. KYL-1 TaxID=2602068 RepID=UPI00210075BD|nr:hypothetical protein [Methanosarcina sp. KYL-1]MCQ1536822.1 hypothetical protein [Methanosarcina sp. KYL-1]
MHSSASDFRPDFGVYNSSGKLLAGNESFEGYAELAKQLDIKRSALYVETRKNEILLGCSLLVKIKMGREERAVFIANYAPEEIISRATSSPVSISTPTYAASAASDTSADTSSSVSTTASDTAWIKRFYGEAKTRLENLETLKYQVLGLWEAGDLEEIHATDINAVGIPEKSLAYPAGKLLSGQRVSVRTAGLSDGISFMGSLISKLGPLHSTGLSFALSLYPSPSDVSVSPGEPDPDFHLGSGEIRPDPGQASYAVRFYGLLYGSFTRLAGNPEFRKLLQNNAGNRDKVSGRILESLLENSPSETIDAFASAGAMDSFFGLYRKNPKALKAIVDALFTTHLTSRLIIIHDKGLAADLIMELGEAQPENKWLEAFLIELYRGLDDRDTKIRIHRHFLENKVLYETFIAELMLLLEKLSREKPKDPSLLRMCAGTSFYGNRRGKEAFEAGVKKGLKDLSHSRTTGFLKYAINVLDTPAEGGRILLEALVPEKAAGTTGGLTGGEYGPAGSDFASRLNKTEVRKLDMWLGRDYLKEIKRKKSRKMKKIIIYACSLSLILISGFLILSYMAPGPVLPAITFSENNSTGMLPFTIQLEYPNGNGNESGMNESGVNGSGMNESGAAGGFGNDTIVNDTDGNATNVSNATEINVTNISNETEVNATNVSNATEINVTNVSNATEVNATNVSNATDTNEINVSNVTGTNVTNVSNTTDTNETDTNVT